MGRCAWELSLSLGRAATSGEILARYLQLGLNTGDDDDGNRAQLAQGAADWLTLNYDPHKGKGLDLDASLALVRQYVTAEIRDGLKRTSRAAYSDEELSIVLYTIERASFKRADKFTHQWTVPNNSLLAMLQRMGFKIENVQSERNKLAVIKRALCASGLAINLDSRWRVGIHGKRYVIGPNHPRHEDHLAFREQLRQDGAHPICDGEHHPGRDVNDTNFNYEATAQEASLLLAGPPRNC